ncbi:GNAT family N-acetyltransferase [Dinghuibacter silviterrae]|uniref:N-acetylglutamate synthase-like GNAT family acetyltransferase n=1 Tax=Dinghuibacter silviterrae TaxID=1539049 RepID=A0A4V3GLT2_9BACT|nr:GNAT family N-acetyltransferase [Dinghuibacter silviterrae]TDX00733.1 N-acetylglutamate synthase-like GNAT family acetyltransferase [Dinghuibacter silviterrae]
MEWTQDGYTLSTDKTRLDVEAIHHFLSTESYWALHIPRSIVERAIEHSLCFGMYDGPAQVGFARVVTDTATFGYLADVYVLPAHRGKGLSKWLMACIMAHPDLQGLRRFMLGTRDAHGLYAQYGFTQLSRPQRLMEVLKIDPYGPPPLHGSA